VKLHRGVAVNKFVLMVDEFENSVAQSCNTVVQLEKHGRSLSKKTLFFNQTNPFFRV
jgi:hypothetical protein